MSQDLDDLRDRLRRLRRSLPPERQDSAAEGLLARIRDRDFFRAGRRVAFYMAVAGEISPGPLLQYALDEKKSCFLPVVAGEHELDFISYESGSSLVENRWGIPEPEEGMHIEPRSLDLVFVPLVGFTGDCARLGNGKAYYDRAFAFRLTCTEPRPMLVGLAHDCQLLESLPVREWDVPLDAVATPERIFCRGDRD